MDRAIAVHALLLHSTVFQTLEQGTTRFAVVFAVAETARTDQVVELDEAGFDVCPADVAQAELTNTR
ncbi:hypothetical protein F2S71_23830 [Pseudomonas syringae pv. actinidiae]|nr:hypothetical protein [Pseudomonas syringae pv. actinidiae]